MSAHSAYVNKGRAAMLAKAMLLSFLLAVFIAVLCAIARLVASRA